MFYVKLEYFKENGKWYADGHFLSLKEDLWKIWEQVDGLSRAKRLPGLIEGHSDYHVLIDVPSHPYNVPHLVTVETTRKPKESYEDVIVEI